VALVGTMRWPAARPQTPALPEARRRPMRSPAEGPGGRPVIQGSCAFASRVADGLEYSRDAGAVGAFRRAAAAFCSHFRLLQGTAREQLMTGRGLPLAGWWRARKAAWCSRDSSSISVAARDQLIEGSRRCALVLWAEHTVCAPQTGRARFAQSPSSITAGKIGLREFLPHRPTSSGYFDSDERQPPARNTMASGGAISD